MASFDGWDPIASWLAQPLQGGGLLFPTKLSQIINLGRVKG